MYMYSLAPRPFERGREKLATTACACAKITLTERKEYANRAMAYASGQLLYTVLRSSAECHQTTWREG